MLKFAIIGCGNIGKRHIPIIQMHGTIVGVCDINKEVGIELSKNLKCNFNDNWDTLLSDTKPDIAVICTPNGCHAHHAIQAIERGIHVIVEKPMAISYHDCINMIEKAQSKKVQLWVVKQNRCNPYIKKIKSLLETNQIGEILHFQMHGAWQRPNSYFENSWHGNKELDGGILFTQFSHFIDLLIWFMGYPSSISHVKNNKTYKSLIDGEQAGAMVCSFDNGSFASFHYGIDAIPQNLYGGFTLITEKASIQIGGAYFNEVVFDSTGYLADENRTVELSHHIYSGYTGSGNLHKEWYSEVLDGFLHREFIHTNLRSASLSVKLIESIYSKNNI